MSRHPLVKWAQRFDKLYITVELPDAEDVKLKLEPEGKFLFSATGGTEKIPYEVDFDLFDKESKASVTSRHVCYLVKKAQNKWWDRLLKQGGKPPVFLKVDWDKWIDEEEEPKTKFGTGTNMDLGDGDFSKLNMGEGMSSGAAGMDDESEDSDTGGNLEGPSLSENTEEAPPTEDRMASSTVSDAKKV